MRIGVIFCGLDRFDNMFKEESSMDNKPLFTRGSHSFTFQFFPETGLLSLWNIGWEVQTSPQYHWDGNARFIDNNTIIFQYTISGRGILEIDDRKYELRPHQAFLVSVPGDHRYYYPNEAKEPWEFIYIALQGPTVRDIWERLVRKSGPVLKMEPNSPLIRSLFAIYAETKADRLRDPYVAASQGYLFLLECFRALSEDTPPGDPYHYQQALNYIEANYHRQISLDDIAEQIGLSRYSLTRLFKRHVHKPPMHYVTELRIRKACTLLLHTNYSVKKIATDVGYLDDNYFHKVFKRYTGKSASHFRRTGDLSQLHSSKMVK